MALDSALLEILRCPADHAAVVHDQDASTLTCVECGRVFRVLDGLPVMLLDDAATPSGDASAVEDTK